MNVKRLMNKELEYLGQMTPTWNNVKNTETYEPKIQNG